MVAGLSTGGAEDQAALTDMFRLMIARVQDYAMFLLDPEGNILSWNPGAQRLKQYTAEEAIGKNFRMFYAPEDQWKPPMELDVARREGRVEDEGWRLRKDGTRFWANVIITALRDDSGKLLGFAKVTRDLSGRKAAEEAIRESEQRLRLLIDSVQDYAIFMLDPTGHIASWNPGAERIKGYKTDEVIGKHFSIFYTPEDRNTDKPKRELEIAITNGRYEEEGWRVRKDGTRFWANVILTPVRNAAGELQGFAKVTRDLTERQRAQERMLADTHRLALEEAARTAAEQRAQELRALAEELEQQAEELEQQTEEAETANRAKSDFLAAMSHELRTPLNAIGGYTQLLRMEISGPLTDTQKEQLERIERNQVHLLGIINDILNFSRIEAGQIEYDTVPVEVTELFDSVLPMVAPQADAKHLKLKSHVEKTVIANADRPKVEQILINLLSNAIKFTDEKGTIELSAGTKGNHVWICVKDTGIGIPKDEQDSVFAPFVQVGRSLATPKEGTGLGLAISRDLARAMKGDLRVESEEGKGSAFTLTLPRQQ